MTTLATIPAISVTRQALFDSYAGRYKSPARFQPQEVLMKVVGIDPGTRTLLYVLTDASTINDEKPGQRVDSGETIAQFGAARLRPAEVRTLWPHLTHHEKVALRAAGRHS